MKVFPKSGGVLQKVFSEIGGKVRGMSGEGLKIVWRITICARFAHHKTSTNLAPIGVSQDCEDALDGTSCHVALGSRF